MNKNTATTAQPLSVVKKQGRAAAILPIACFPALMNDFTLELPQARRKRSNEEIGKLIAAGDQKPNESFPAFMERCAFEDVPAVRKTVKELKAEGLVSTIPVSLGMLTASSADFFRAFILKNATNKGDLGYLTGKDDAAEATA